MGTRCALYIRVSTDDQADAAEEQERGGRAWCQRQGHEVAAVFRDVGVSGAEFKNRPGVLELQRQAKLSPRPFDLVVTRDADRLGRDGVLLPLLVATLAEHGVKAVAWSTGEAIAAGDGLSNIILSVRAGVAQMQREQIAHVTRTSLRTRAERGLVAGGRVYGYDNLRGPDGVRYVVNEREAEIVREVFCRRAAGEGLRAIAGDLNRRGVPSPNARLGCTWAQAEIRVIAGNLRYRGVAQFGRRTSKYVGGSRVVVDQERDRVVTYEVPRIVDDELWHAAQANTAEVAAARGGYVHRGPAPKYLLVGMACCGGCSGRIGSASSSSSTATGRVTVPGYACGVARERNTCPARWRRPAHRLDGVVLDWLVNSVLSPDVFAAALAQSRAELEASLAAPPVPRAADLRTRIDDLERRVGRLVRALEVDDGPDVLDALRSRRAELVAARAELAAIDAPPIALPSGAAASAILARLEGLRPVVEAAREENPALLRAVLGAVLVGPVKITEHERKGPLTIEAEAAPGALLSAVLPNEGLAARGMRGIEGAPWPHREKMPREKTIPPRGGYGHIPVSR